MKKIIISIFLLTIGLSLSGCLSEEERENLNKKEKLAEEYFEDKYQKNVRIKESDYIYTEDSVFPTPTEDMYFVLKDGTFIYYDAEKDLFLDNYQAEEIMEDIEDKIWNPMIDEVDDYRYGNENQGARLYVNYYDVGSEYSSFFHEYYDGNIKSYAKEETLSPQIGGFGEGGYFQKDSIYFICEEDEWEEKFDIIQETMDDYFEGSVDVVALTEELYNTEVIGNNESITTAWEGCWATLGKEGQVVQHYVPLADGIYASNAKDYILKKGDIVLEECESEQVDIKGDYNVYSPIYRITISERVWEHAEDGIIFYIKISPEEIGLTSEHNLYYFNTGDTYYNNVPGNNQKSGKAVYIQKKEEANTMFLFLGNQ